MTETAASVVEELQVFKEARGRRCGDPSHAWFFVAPLRGIVLVAMGVKISSAPPKVVTNVCNVFLEKRNIHIWISNIGGNASGILVAIRQASLLRLSPHVYRRSKRVEAATTVVHEHQVFKNTRGRRRSARVAWFFVATFVEIISFAMGVKIRSIAVEVVTNVRDIFLEEWQLSVWIPNIGRDADWVFITVRQACLLGLGPQF